jgi:LPXTG-motif cell wall-anchored protein
LNGRTISRVALLAVTLTTATVAATGPAGADPPATHQKPAAQAVQLEVSADFDKPSYRTGELITVTFRIKNVGTEKATALDVRQEFTPTELGIPGIRQWGALKSPAGATIDPGATFETVLSGLQGRPDAKVVTLSGTVFVRGAANVADFAFSAPITTRQGRVAGAVFGDANSNGNFDAGEELPGIAVALSYNGTEFRTATSGPDGRFDFGQVPTVTFFTGSTVAGPWQFPLKPIDVDESDGAGDIRIRGVKPLNGALHASMRFTKDTYQPGELAHLTVTLSNSGPVPLIGIVAACDRSGAPHGLSGAGPGWGLLAFRAGGVTVPAGATKDFDVSEKVPESAVDVGLTFANCDFGYAEIDIENHPTASDTAKVPGGIATVVGDVLESGQSGAGVAGVRLILVHERTCPIVAETTSDGNGHFEFRNLAPDQDYLLYIVPPPGWKVRFDNPTRPDVRGGEVPSQLLLEMQRGEGPVPAIPCAATPATPTTSTAPAPQGRSDGGLADTGADVAGLGVLGLVVLMLGSGALVIARRRRPTG